MPGPPAIPGNSDTQIVMDVPTCDRILTSRPATPSAAVRRIRRFVSALAEFPSTQTLRNPYRARHRRQNLETYLAALLAWPYSGHLLVGEAPGERGCARTGIPFTDERLLRAGLHPFLRSLQSAVKVGGLTAESTAGIVWQHLHNCDHVPAFWNAVPFHPRAATQVNRAPTAAELVVGQAYLRQLLDLLAPHSVIAVGRTAELALHRLGLNGFAAVRHPSHGGKRAFIAGLTSAGLGAPVETL